MPDMNLGKNIDRKLTLITGRSTKQGKGISTGKFEEEYQDATSFLELNREDMERFGLQTGDPVIIRSHHGETTVKCRPADLPAGLAFLAFGPASSELLGGETHASGMPDSKGFDIELEQAAESAA